MADPKPMIITDIPNTRTAREMARFTHERPPFSLESLRWAAAGKTNIRLESTKLPAKES